MWGKSFETDHWNFKKQGGNQKGIQCWRLGIGGGTWYRKFHQTSLKIWMKGNRENWIISKSWLDSTKEDF